MSEPPHSPASQPPAPPPPAGGGRAPAAWLTYLAVITLFLSGGAAVQFLPGGERWQLALSQIGFVLLPALLAVRLTGGSARRDLRLRRLGLWPAVLSAGTAVCALPLLSVLLSQLERVLPGGDSLEEALTDLLRARDAWDALAICFLAVILPAVCEETLFRGWILTGLGRSHSRGTAVVVQAVLFGLLHAHPLRILPTTLLGVLLGWLALCTRSLLAPIVAHAAFNGTIVLLVQVGDTGGDTSAVPLRAGTILVLLAAGTLLSGGIVLLRRVVTSGSGEDRGEAVGEP